MKNLSNFYFKEFEKRNTFKIENYATIFKDVNLVEFLTYTFKNYSEIYVHRLIINNLQLIESLKLIDWQNIIVNNSSNKIALYSIGVFLGKYLNLNVVDLFEKTEIKNKKNKLATLDYFKSRPKLFILMNLEIKEMESANINLQLLQIIEKRLINEGANYQQL
mgnify:CR=1 FL=1